MSLVIAFDFVASKIPLATPGNNISRLILDESSSCEINFLQDNQVVQRLVIRRLTSFVTGHGASRESRGRLLAGARRRKLKLTVFQKYRPSSSSCPPLSFVAFGSLGHSRGGLRPPQTRNPSFDSLRLLSGFTHLTLLK